ncbi:MAG: hypothetical protein ACFWT8_08300 [Lacticaseibacillus casei]
MFAKILPINTSTKTVTTMNEKPGYYAIHPHQMFDMIHSLPSKEPTIIVR